MPSKRSVTCSGAKKPGLESPPTFRCPIRCPSFLLTLGIPLSSPPKHHEQEEAAWGAAGHYDRQVAEAMLALFESSDREAGRRLRSHVLK